MLRLTAVSLIFTLELIEIDFDLELNIYKNFISEFLYQLEVKMDFIFHQPNLRPTQGLFSYYSLKAC